MENETVINVRGLTKKYSNIVALRNIDLDIPKGQIVGLLGPNGSGKTTFIKVLANLLMKYEGDVKIDGKELGIETKKIVSYLPDKDYLDNNWTSNDIDAVFHLAEGKSYLATLKQIVLKIAFLLTYPSKGQTCCNINVGFGDALSPKLSRNRGKGEDVIILIIEFVGFELLVPDTDGIILAVPYEQVGYKGRFGITFDNTRGKAAVCRFHIAVAVVDTDEIGLVHFLHTFISPFYCL